MAEKRIVPPSTAAVCGTLMAVAPVALETAESATHSNSSVDITVTAEPFVQPRLRDLPEFEISSAIRERGSPAAVTSISISRAGVASSDSWAAAPTEATERRWLKE